MKSIYVLQLVSLFLFIVVAQQVEAQFSESSKSHHHDFDFWIGTWNVYKYGTDTLVGLSEIQPILDHTAIEENYQGWQNNFRGTSHNVFNAAKNRWEQFWVDNSGLTLHIKGGLEDGKMVLSECKNAECNKIVWSPLEGQEVRQECMVSKDGGATWNTVFDGHYKAAMKADGAKPALQHLISFSNVRDFTLSNDGNEAYITIQNPTEESRVICRMQRSFGNWSVPMPATFSGKHKDLEPYFSPDNLRLYFVSNRPNAFDKENYDIYYVEREHLDSSWSAPINLGSPINTADNEFYPAVARSGNIYYTSVKAKDNGRDDIYLSTFSNNQYTSPVSLDTTINTAGYEFNSFVSPDESFLIFSGYNRPDGLGSGDMYISYRNADMTWTKAENLGPQINSRYMDYCPFVDVDKRILYFTSRRNLPLDGEIQTHFQLEREMLKYQNGLSRIYQVNFNKVKQ